MVERCGKYDDEDFDSLAMCCNCSGGGFGTFILFFLNTFKYDRRTTYHFKFKKFFILFDNFRWYCW